MAHEAIHGLTHGPGGDDDISGAYQAKSERGQPNGYAGLDGDGKVPSAALPAMEGVEGSTLPAGLIVLWYGLLANIPTGWVLCDGQNGTPDLRSKFIKGAAAAVEPGATGGALTHTHADHAALSHAGTAVADHASHTHTYSQIVNHTHGITDPGHTHVQNAHNHVITSQTATTGAATSYEHGTLDTSSAEAEATEVTANATAVNQSATTGISTQNPAGGVASGTTAGPSATLSHSVTQPNNHAAQSHETVNHEPPWVGVAFIMKT